MKLHFMDINIGFSTLQRAVVNSDPHRLLALRISCIQR